MWNGVSYRRFVARTLRLAVAQSVVPSDPADRSAVRSSGAQIRELMCQASAAGARLVQFPEGALVYPNKRVLSTAGGRQVGEADWSLAAWDVLTEQAESIATLAGSLGLWVAFGSVHPLTAPHRPHNSMYVVSDTGDLVTRYDKRFLSQTEVSYMYTPGTRPVTFTIDGFRFGLALCIEAEFPEVFAEYDALDVDCVLLSVMVDDAVRASLAQAYGRLHGYWIGYAVPAQYGATAPAGIVAPGGRWLTRCPGDCLPALAIADIDLDATDSDMDIAMRHARPWRRSARGGLYDDHLVTGDPRSDSSTTF